MVLSMLAELELGVPRASRSGGSSIKERRSR
jgi:hypothetical protein